MKNSLYFIVAIVFVAGLFVGCASKPAPKDNSRDKQMYQEFKADQADKALDNELNK